MNDKNVQPGDKRKLNFQNKQNFLELLSSFFTVCRHVTSFFLEHCYSYLMIYSRRNWASVEKNSWTKQINNNNSDFTYDNETTNDKVVGQVRSSSLGYSEAHHKLAPLLINIVFLPGISLHDQLYRSGE